MGRCGWLRWAVAGTWVGVAWARPSVFAGSPGLTAAGAGRGVGWLPGDAMEASMQVGWGSAGEEGEGEGMGGWVELVGPECPRMGDGEVAWVGVVSVGRPAGAGDGAGRVRFGVGPGVGGRWRTGWVDVEGRGVLEARPAGEEAGGRRGRAAAVPPRLKEAATVVRVEIRHRLGAVEAVEAAAWGGLGDTAVAGAIEAARGRLGDAAVEDAEAAWPRRVVLVYAFKQLAWVDPERAARRAWGGAAVVGSACALAAAWNFETGRWRLAEAMERRRNAAKAARAKARAERAARAGRRKVRVADRRHAQGHVVRREAAAHAEEITRTAKGR